jgi:hypothetical protein
MKKSMATQEIKIGFIIECQLACLVGSQQNRKRFAQKQPNKACTGRLELCAFLGLFPEL